MVGSGVYYLHEDALGSVRLVATATVTITFSSNYVPYGQSYAMTGKEVFMYTGKPYDSVTGLYYYGARYYDDSIGRFVTEDSFNGSKNDPLSQNRYIYARDNPMKLVDADGHAVRDPRRSYELVSLLIPFITLTWIGPVPIISVEWMVMTFWVLLSGTTNTNPNNGGGSPNTSCQRGDVHCFATGSDPQITISEIFAWVVTFDVGGLTAFAGLCVASEYAAMPVTGFSSVLGVGLSSFALAEGVSATIAMVNYDEQYGSNANPEQALQVGLNAAETDLPDIIQAFLNFVRI